MTEFDPTAPADVYLSTTIPYVNAAPHVGFALELCQLDAVARYLRLVGQRVRTSTGTDDHSLKNVRAAGARGQRVEELVRANASAFADLDAALGITFDDVVNTSRHAAHRTTVEQLWRRCAARGDLYERTYRGAYCVGCEQFYDPSELCAGRCPEHDQPLELVEERNWFFRLSRYARELTELIADDRLRIYPEQRKNEVLGFISGGLEDFSVSRSAERAHGFGIAVPDDPTQVVYVWVDALANYLSASASGAPGERAPWQEDGERWHFLGKGVTRFHAVYWPALLSSAGLRLPDQLRIHGYLTVDGKKIGKSAGNGIDPNALIRELGVDALRYYLLRHIPPFKDADFSKDRLLAVHDSELADELGNLARRVVTLARRHPALGALVIGEREIELETRARALSASLARSFAHHELALALTEIWELVRASNRYLDRTEPWKLARAGTAAASDELGRVLSTALAALRLLSRTLDPFVPDLARRLSASVGVTIAPGDLASTSLLDHARQSRELGPPVPLVPRLKSRAPAG